jgi:hypothetical protein
MTTERHVPPVRIQRKRTKGWRMPEGAVYVGRGTAYGNPFRIYEHCKGSDWGVEDTGRFFLPYGHGWTRIGAARAAVNLYRQELDAAYPEGSTAREILALNLRGRDLACWCPLDQPCHADVLLEVANG